MKKTLILWTLGLLLGCDPVATTDAGVSTNGSSSAETSFASSASDVLHQVPPELTLDSFGNMRLEGSDFRLEDVLGDHALYTRYTISYRSNGLLITGILNVPKGQGSFPLLLLNHGYIDRDIYTNGRGLKREQDYLARNGFAVLHSDYRGHAGGDESPDERKVYDAGLEYSMDVLNGIDAIREAKIPSIDASRVGMLGHSMGGGITQNIITAYPDAVDAAVLYAPVHTDAWKNFERWRDRRDDDDRTVELYGRYEENPAFWQALSSKNHLSKIAVPVLVFHGDNDKDVPKEWSDELVKMLTQLGKEIEYVEYPGEGHEFGPQWSDFMLKSKEFFTEHLQD
ncbi:alpha/beta fold hydrolase [Candidatus Peregrinibacteria bacterium]|nr:alpha/beta fold hydrolase [Candidatus Peregrinibacteria bacterium]